MIELTTKRHIVRTYGTTEDHDAGADRIYVDGVLAGYLFDGKQTAVLLEPHNKQQREAIHKLLAEKYPGRVLSLPVSAPSITTPGLENAPDDFTDT